MRHRASIRRSIRVALAGVALWTALVSAQSDMPPATGVGPGTAGSSPAASERRTGATLSLYNRPLITFRAPMLGAAPADRAEVARVRVANLLEGGGPAVVSLHDVSQGTAVLVDDQFAFIVTHEDALLTDGGGARQLADRVAEALRRVVAETRESRDSAFLVRAGIAAGIATVLFLCLVVLTRWVWRRVARALIELAQRHAERLTIGGGEVISPERAIATARQGVAVIATLALFLLAWEWLSYVLALFPYTRPWSEELRSFLGRAALGVLESVARSLPSLVVAILIFVVARFVDGVQRRFFDRVEAGQVALAAIDRDTAPATRRLATIAVWLFAVAMAYPYIPGSETDAFKGLSVLLGLMVSVGASGIVGQAASGLILMYTRTYRPGEFVQIAGRDGTVIAMGLFTTRMRTGMGEELTLPNSLVMGSIVTNHSRGANSTGFVAQASVTIGYDVPWRQVHAMLEDAARRTDGVCPAPPPRVYQTALSDFYVEYRLACEVAASEPGARIAVISALNAAIQDVFNEHGVQIMSPHYYSDPERPKVVPPARWHAPPARTP